MSFIAKSCYCASRQPGMQLLVSQKISHLLSNGRDNSKNGLQVEIRRHTQWHATRKYTFETRNIHSLRLFLFLTLDHYFAFWLQLELGKGFVFVNTKKIRNNLKYFLILFLHTELLPNCINWDKCFWHSHNGLLEYWPIQIPCEVFGFVSPKYEMCCPWATLVITWQFV